MNKRANKEIKIAKTGSMHRGKNNKRLPYNICIAVLIFFIFLNFLPFFANNIAPKLTRQIHATEPQYQEDLTFATALEDATKKQDNQTIKKIVIRGEQNHNAEDILGFIEVHEGEKYDSDKVNSALKKLYTKNFFSQLDAHFAKGILTINVKENPFIHNITFEGNKVIKDNKLKELLEVNKKRFFSNRLLKNDLDKLIYAYQIQGYHSVVIEPKFQQLEQNRINITYVIHEGKKARIANIAFIGNSVFKNKELLSVINSKITSGFSLFSRNSLYDESLLEFDKTLLENKYRDAGYYDFVVQNISSELSSDRTAFVITFTLDEGLPYTISDFQIISDIRDIPASAFNKIREKIVVGEVANREKIENVKEEINKILLEKGYAFAQVNCEEIKNKSEHSIAFKCELDHGFKTYINQINIRGNERTADEVIRRHLDIHEGQAYSLEKVKLSQYKLHSLGYFSKVNIEPKRTNVPDKADFDIEVTEKSTGTLTFNVQLSNQNGLAVIFSLTEMNIAGTGNIFEFSLNRDRMEKGGKVKFINTSLLGSSISGGIEVFYNNKNSIFSAIGQKGIKNAESKVAEPTTSSENSELFKHSDLNKVVSENNSKTTSNNVNDYQKISYGTRLPITYELGNNLRHGISYSLFWEDLKVSDKLLQNPNKSDFLKPFYNTKILKSGISTDLLYDSRDNKYLPSKGQIFYLKLQLNGLGGDINTVQSELMGRAYFPIYKDKVIAKISGHYGEIFGLNKQKVRITDNFQLGQDKMRGFDINGIGVVDGKNKDKTDFTHLGGKTYYQASAELMMPAPFIPEDVNLKIILFHDLGTCYGTDVTDSAQIKPDPTQLYESRNIRASIGAGLVWISPFGPISLEYGYPYQKESFDATESIRFSFGSRTAF